MVAISDKQMEALLDSGDYKNCVAVLAYLLKMEAEKNNRKVKANATSICFATGISRSIVQRTLETLISLGIIIDVSNLDNRKRFMVL